jgi:hypothetical protein
LNLYFGLALDDVCYPLPKATTGGVDYCGPQKLLLILESHLGIIGHPPENEYLRIEQYRQALAVHLEQNPNAFFKASFEADQFATAARLLAMRDEAAPLPPGGGMSREKSPLQEDLGRLGLERLACLSEIEQLFENPDRTLAFGFADRFRAVLEYLDKRKQPIQAIFLVEPLNLLPAHFQQLFKKLELLGVKLHELQTNAPEGDRDLAVFQRTLWREEDLPDFQNPANPTHPANHKQRLRGDGSLLLIRGKRDMDVASYLAQLFRHNPDFKPVCLIPNKSRTLESAAVQEGQPSLGIPSASLARPTLQVLKLITVFVWNPVDPFKIMEFVSLAIKPLETELANRIANLLAQTPGLRSDRWIAVTAQYFEELDNRARHDRSLDAEEIRFQYRFWFERQRYDSTKRVPKDDVMDIFNYLHRWARRQFEEKDTKNNSLLVLSEQAKRIRDLLGALPETQLTNLELERIVRTIYEPAPVHFSEQELGFLPYVHHTNAFVEDVEYLLWWNFTQAEPAHFFSRWYNQEREYLASQGIRVQTPSNENELLIWQRRQPVLRTRKQLILAIPAIVDGSEVHPHPLFGNLEATFSNLDDILFDLDTEKGRAAFEQHFKLPKRIQLLHRQLGKPRAFLQVKAAERLQSREEETFSSLESLFYYPYQWVFRHKIKLSKSSILSVVKDAALMGNLAHGFFERLFQQDIRSLSKTQIEQWVEQESKDLLAREGAVLLLYGREPERVGFVKKVKYAAWCLVNLIQKNGWRVVATEQALAGKFLGIPVNGRADLVLEKDGELAVLDLKWRGARRREEIIRNEADLQLVLYSKLLTDDHTWAHTAYFILENGKLIARNNQAFKEVNPIVPDSDHVQVHERILSRMQATYHWRMQQLQAGKVEIRCQQTQLDLEEAYQNQLLELLEMKSEDAPYDDYRVLINLIE